MTTEEKRNLRNKIKEIEGLTEEERYALLGFLKKDKKYGLVWEEKEEDIQEKLRGELPVLIERDDEKVHPIISDNPDAPNHLIIEGDNLAALTELSYTHFGKIDVIYIDPPYNTGKKDFVYNDTYVDSEDNFRHSKWLSFISKRLKIAKTLLAETGVIFISIDDNEQANLKILCDEIFGNKNFLGQIILKTATDNNPSQINTEHEYILVYCNNKELQGNWQRQSKASKLLSKKGNELLSQYISLEEAQKELRKWIKSHKEELRQVTHYNNIDKKGVYSSSSNSSNPHPGGYIYDILHPITGFPCPRPANGWRWPESTFLNYQNEGEIEWGKDHTTQPHIKKRIETATEHLRTLIYEDNRGTTKELIDIFNGEKRFDNPKPQTVLSRIFDFVSIKDSVFLDFFAGSGTTLHAVMQLNNEDGGYRQCILCTNNENNICEDVTYERNKRVIEGYTKPNGEFVEGLKDNNLRYYRTEFLSRERTQANLRELAYKSTNILCIKEDLYIEKSKFGEIKLNPSGARYFEDKGRGMLIIYMPEFIPAFVEQIRKMEFNSENPLKVYVYSPGRYAFNDEFESVADKIELYAIPENIIEAMVRVLPDRKEEKS